METLRGLLEKTLREDQEAFGDVVDRFQDMAFACAFATLRDREDAEDAVQDAFITAYCKLAELRDLDRFPGWLRQIVMSACGRIMRRPTLPTAPIEAAERIPASDGDPAARSVQTEHREEVLDALSSLSPAYRITTVLYYMDGYKIQEIADFLEIPSGTVKYRLHESRKRLKERMVTKMHDSLSAQRPDPGLRQSILEELTARKARFDESIRTHYIESDVSVEEDRWAAGWHELRMEDVRANAAQYGIEADETLPRMLPEYQKSETFRDDFADIPRRWGVPEGTRLIDMRDLARALLVTPLALHRWEAEGLPVLRYRPWSVYDEERAMSWAQTRGIRAEERMTEEQAREPMLLTLHALAAGEATVEEALAVCHGLECFGWRRSDPLWEPTWRANRKAEKEANARLYGLSTATATYWGVPAEAEPRIFEVRDLCRRLGFSPFDVIRWTREGMPCVRQSPDVRWDCELTATWLASRASLPSREFSAHEIDDMEKFVFEAVANGEGSATDASEILAGWAGIA